MKILDKTYKIIRKNPLLPGLIIFLLVTIALFSELISPNDPLYSDLSKIKQPPFYYKAPFSPIDVVEEYSRPARIMRNGEVITKKLLKKKCQLRILVNGI